ncbi:MAG: flagellar biosynthesis protein FlhA [bacterium]|nr:flagellar biosynthesis protein FlhA [bacterium]MDW8164653.1 flagellar biosynthesis protein FlhA [Candidatus Omnitrophota bacterium]
MRKVSVDIFVIIGIIGILVFMIFPISPHLLDILLVSNLTVAIWMFILTFYIDRPIDFSVFPSLLILATLYQISLNIASTRLILLNGYAGRVISAFGIFLTKGNFIVGVIIFLIFIIVQAIAITRGAQRISEVAARFTLDALPGKQLTIDSDLNAGLIDEETARKKREELRREADFYGAMDGSGRFIRGNVFVSLLITAIDIIGGILIGVFQKNLSFNEAIRQFGLLTIGDGIVTQIPAIFTSTAAGIIVARQSTTLYLPQEIVKQLLSSKLGITILTVIVFLIAWIPGLPKWPFFLMSATLILIWNLFKEEKISESKEEIKRPTILLEEKIITDPIELVVGYELVPLVSSTPGILDRIPMIREQIAEETGVIIPLIRVRDDYTLKKDTYIIKIYGKVVAEYSIKAGKCFAIETPNTKKRIQGIPVKEPIEGGNAFWINPEDKPIAEKEGYTVIEPEILLITHLKYMLRKNLEQLLTRQHTQNLIEVVRKNSPALVDEVIPKILTIGEIHQILRYLIKEGISINNMYFIMDTISTYAPINKDIIFLVEKIRQGMGKSLYYELLENNKLKCVVLGKEFEELIQSQINLHKDQTQITISPSFFKEITHKINEFYKPPYRIALLCSSNVRPYISQILKPFFPKLKILSYEEIELGIDIEVVSVVK